MRFIPDLLKMQDGTPVTAETWRTRREEMLDILRREEYGYAPPAPKEVRGEITAVDGKCACGKGVIEHITLSFDTPKGEFQCPIRFCYPADGKAHPTFLFIHFRDTVYDKYMDIDAVIERGFAVANVCYKDITSDDADMANGLCGMFERPCDGTGYGKITIWAYAVSRMLDYVLTRPETDGRYIASIGHSRLGKTSLWCAAQDERIGMAIANDSGCAGAAYERLKAPKAETVAAITKNFPYWFCENYHAYAGRADAMPFDQHFLLAAIAPRRVCVGSASEDVWADPYGEQRSCIAATPAWRLLGKSGYAGTEEPMRVGEKSVGEISYHLRDGIHYLGRPDWRFYSECFDKFIEESK